MTVSLSSVLIQLTEAAERVMNRMAAPSVEDTTLLLALHRQVQEAVAVPSEGSRIVGDHETLLADVLCKIAWARRYGAPARAALWCQIAGVLLPAVRADLSAVIDARRNTIPATTSQTRDGK